MFSNWDSGLWINLTLTSMSPGPLGWCCGGCDSALSLSLDPFTDISTYLFSSLVLPIPVLPGAQSVACCSATRNLRSTILKMLGTASSSCHWHSHSNCPAVLPPSPAANTAPAASPGRTRVPAAAKSPPAVRRGPMALALYACGTTAARRRSNGDGRGGGTPPQKDHTKTL